MSNYRLAAVQQFEVATRYPLDERVSVTIEGRAHRVAFVDVRETRVEVWLPRVTKTGADFANGRGMWLTGWPSVEEWLGQAGRRLRSTLIPLMTNPTTARKTTDDIAADLAERANHRMSPEVGIVGPHARPAISVLREADEDLQNLATVAECRARLRGTLRTREQVMILDADYYALPVEEARRLGHAAMAALGTVDETAFYTDSRGKPMRVGPYVSDAVSYVLRGVQHTTADRSLVADFAMLFNVAARIAP
jgi:hypothetical protein